MHTAPFHITSRSNPKIKWIKSLHKNNFRRKEGLFLAEGLKEVLYAIENSYEPMYMFICTELIIQKIDPELLQADFMYTVSREVFNTLVYRSNSDGIVAIFKTKKHTLDTINFGENPLFLILESIEKPGNLGAIIRTADGAGFDGIISCDELVDFFNPNVIRASVGTVFCKQIASGTNQQVLNFLEKHEITPFGAIPSNGSQIFTEVDFTKPSAIILGSEHDGLSEFWKSKVTPITIPMLGQNDSLNVSNAAAIISYEAVRQRRQKHVDQSLI